MSQFRRNKKKSFWLQIRDFDEFQRMEDIFWTEMEEKISLLSEVASQLRGAVAEWSMALLLPISGER